MLPWPVTMLPPPESVTRKTATLIPINLTVVAAVNTLLASQLCATSYYPLEQKTLGAVPGVIVQARGRCRSHIPLFGP